MSTFFDKDKWTKSEKLIYINNINVLRNDKGLNKKTFSGQVGVKNAFRKQGNRPNAQTVELICEKFKVTKEWLSTPHGPDADPAPRSLRVSEAQSEYTPQPTADEMGQLIGYAHQVLNSASTYAQALGANIRAFHQALQAETKAVDQDEKIKEQGQRIEALTNQNKELNEKCDNLTKRIEYLESKLMDDKVRSTA